MGTDLSWVKALGGGLTGNTGPISVLTFGTALLLGLYLTRKLNTLGKTIMPKKQVKLGFDTKSNSTHKKKRQNKYIHPGCWEGAVDAPPSQYP
jgi:hypothetical protein